MNEAAFVEPPIMKALGHPIRSGIIRLLATEATLSPRRTISLLPVSEVLSLSQVNYHIWLLGKDGLIEPATRQSGPAGTVAYRATAKGREVMVLIGVLPSRGAD
jgi:hypothetical protein